MPSRHWPSRQPTAQATPSAVKPAFFKARCSAGLVVSVLASMRCAVVCANR